ncbi:MAG: hypothetical protein Q9180_006989, partial [Flavoplaca navasiana]
IIAGIIAESLVGTRIVKVNANSAIFPHFRSSVSKELTPEAPKSITAFKESLLISQDAGETHQLLLAALLDKLSHLIALDDVDNERDLSIAELGMDSLIVVELRNWISTELQTPVHVSEILEQNSTRDLANLILSRSALLKYLSDETALEVERPQHRPDFDTEQGMGSFQNVATRTVTEQLPDLPLPELSTSLYMYLEYRRCSLS